MGMTPEEREDFEHIKRRQDILLAKLQYLERKLSPIGLAWADYNDSTIPVPPADWGPLET